MKLTLLCGCASLLLTFHPSTQAPQDKKASDEKAAVDSKPGTSDSAKANPVKATPTSVASGKKAYASDCAMCHGKDGDGGGDLAVDMKLKLRDYRDAAALKDMTDADIYAVIANGKGQMTGEEGRLKSDQIWDVVNYVRSLAKK
jgi:mono/diheme cytochrome c family protein